MGGGLLVCGRGVADDSANIKGVSMGLGIDVILRI